VNLESAVRLKATIEQLFAYPPGHAWQGLARALAWVLNTPGIDPKQIDIRDSATLQFELWGSPFEHAYLLDQMTQHFDHYGYQFGFRAATQELATLPGSHPVSCLVQVQLIPIPALPH
jgi:hypothetical protein